MNMNIKTLNGMDTKTLSSEITNGEIMICLKIQPRNWKQLARVPSTGQQDYLMERPEMVVSHMFFSKFRVQTWRISCTRRGGEDWTPRRTHIFLSQVLSGARMPAHILIMHARVAQVCTSAIVLVMFGVVCTIAHQKHLFIHDVSSKSSRSSSWVVHLVLLHATSATSDKHAPRFWRGQHWPESGSTQAHLASWLTPPLSQWPCHLSTFGITLRSFISWGRIGPTAGYDFLGSLPVTSAPSGHWQPRDFPWCAPRTYWVHLVPWLGPQDVQETTDDVPDHTNICSDGSMEPIPHLDVEVAGAEVLLMLLPSFFDNHEWEHAQDLDGQFNGISRIFSSTSGPLQTVQKTKYSVAILALQTLSGIRVTITWSGDKGVPLPCHGLRSPCHYSLHVTSKGSWYSQSFPRFQVTLVSLW